MIGFGSAALLVVIGIACALAFRGGLAQNFAFVLVALGLVLATSLVFYEVGLTEDHERAREENARRREEELRREPEWEGEREGAAKRGHPPEGSKRIRLDRMRGRPRRLR